MSSDWPQRHQAEKTQTDPHVREKQLLAERERIDAEISELRQTGMPANAGGGFILP
jgi:hypothetical protein